MDCIPLLRREEDEPAALIVDSLLPISADIDPENEYKRSIGKMNNLGDSLVRTKMNNRSRVEEEDNGKQKYKRLQMTEGTEEDGFTQELRKLEDEKNKKE